MYKYILNRFIAGILMYCILIFTYSVIFNTVTEKTLIAQIDEMLRAEKTAIMKENRNIDADKYIEEKKIYYYELNNLDKSVFVRIVWRTYKTLLFDFGESTVMTSKKGSKKVSDIIMEVLPNTIILFTTAQIFIIIISILLGMKKARNAGKKLDKTTTFITMFLFGIPTWWIGMMAIMHFSYNLKWFPTGGMRSVPPPENSAAYFFDFLHHLTLPVSILVITGIWGGGFIIRNIVLGTLQEDYIMSARARGLSENKILYGHALRSSAPPIVTIMLMSLLGSFGGSLIFETIFNWPGMGNLYLIANQQNDIPVLMGNLSFTTGIYIAGIIFLDLIYGLLDPRIKVGGKNDK